MYKIPTSVRWTWQYFQYSIGDAELKSSTYGIPDLLTFQYSIGDAFAAAAFTVWKVIRELSILYWRCPARRRRGARRWSSALSILYWRCPGLLCFRIISFGPTSLSILYWRCRNDDKNLRGVYVVDALSILYWRCFLHLQSLSRSTTL